MSDQLLCAPRDATWHARPHSHHPARWHVTLDGNTPACGAPALLVDPLPLSTAPVSRRCQRPGCKEHWSKADAS